MVSFMHYWNYNNGISKTYSVEEKAADVIWVAYLIYVKKLFSLINGSCFVLKVRCLEHLLLWILFPLGFCQSLVLISLFSLETSSTCLIFGLKNSFLLECATLIAFGDVQNPLSIDLRVLKLCLQVGQESMKSQQLTWLQLTNWCLHCWSILSWELNQAILRDLARTMITLHYQWAWCFFLNALLFC